MAFKPRYRKSRRPLKSRRLRKSKYLKGGSGVVKATKTLTFPDQMIVKQPWITAQQLTNPTSSAAIQYKVRLNSVWDPDVRVGAGQISSYGYPLYSQIYNRYRVLGAKVMVDLYNPNSAIPLKVCLYGTNDPDTDYGGLAAQLQSHMIETAMPPSGTNTAGTVRRLTKYFSCARITGVSDAVYRADDRYQAQIGTNPQEYIGVGLQAIKLGSTEGGVDFGLSFTMKVIYYVQWFDRKQAITISEVPVESQVEAVEVNLVNPIVPA